jgi:hypothetical protein
LKDIEKKEKWGAKIHSSIFLFIWEVPGSNLGPETGYPD